MRPTCDPNALFCGQVVLSEARVREMALWIFSGVKLDPVHVVNVRGLCYIVDGHHRAEVFRRLHRNVPFRLVARCRLNLAYVVKRIRLRDLVVVPTKE
jgi:hypothetical protein